MSLTASRPKSKIILNRVIEDKSYIKFYFFRADNSTPMIFLLPFFSNAVIEESQTASYSKIRPIGRAGTIPTYLGADNRKLRLSFDLIVPHIQAEGKNLNLYTFQYKSTFGSKEEDKARFTSREPIPGQTEGSNKGGAYKLRQSWLHAKRHYLKLFNLDGFTPNQEISIAKRSDLQIYDIVMWWVNLVRSSVINNAEKSLEPPPLIRLSHGIMYNDIPCICTDYRIDNDENAGYDLKTFFPRKLKIKMDLEEIRIGNFGKYYPGLETFGDNLAGWEAIIEHGTKDPYVDILGGYR